MKLYYTSPTAQDQIQSDARLSLGGYKALSSVPNNSFDNLFSEISQFLLSKDIPEDEYIGLILKNETEDDIEDLSFWFEYPIDCYSKFLVAAVNLSVDANGVLCMEHISNKNSKPLYADFYEADGEENAVSFGSMEGGGMLGLWFCRRLVEDLATTVQTDSNLYEVDTEHTDMVKSKIPIKFDSITIHFSWEEYYGGAVGEELLTDYYVTLNLEPVFRGDTYLGCEFTLMSDEDPDVPLKLNGASIVLITNNINYSLSTANDTIRITDPENGKFIIPEQIINWSAAIYNYKIKVTFSSGRIRTYVVGTWEILR